ncbi:AAEL005828-PA [Aedes aegypti]|uniref:AAEL005828-PA n=1 Tax=Aedes aegypti TaxID=7159 RepID=Q178N3_AEDAE|nr:AAEL005828-PA [Aedes aegypti]
MTFTQPSIPTCLAHLILAGVTGWSLKHLPIGHESSHSTTSGDDLVPLMLVLLVFLLGHSLLGIFRHSHPDPHKNLRKMYELSVMLAMILPLPLLNTQLYLKYQLGNGSHLPLYSYLSMSTFLPFLTGCLYSELSQRHKSQYVTTVVTVVNLTVLLWISAFNENYWGIGLAVSYGMKYFTLPRLADRYNVPFVDLHTYGLGFFEIFAINVIIDADLYRTELVIQ